MRQLSEDQGRTSETRRIVAAIADSVVEMGWDWDKLYSWSAPHSSCLWLHLGSSGPFDKDGHFIPVKTTYNNAVLVELYMSRIVCLHGIPKKIVSDRGTQFTSHFFAAVAWSFGHTLEVQFSLSPVVRWSDWENQPDSWGYVESLCFARPVRLGQEATVCRILLQQQLSSQSEDVAIRSTLWEELQNSIALGPTRRKTGIRPKDFAWSRREYQDGLGKSEGSAV